MDILRSALPEEVGVRPEWVSDFITALENRGMMMHSVLFARFGKVFAEGYYAPFKKNDYHRMYSVSKSFASMAVGCLIGEGKISLDDRVADFFPDKIPENPNPYVMQTTVRDCLRMATPYSEGVTYRHTDSDWLATFFNPTKIPADHPSGTLFHYDTAGTYVLCALVERVTDMPFLDYLKEKALRKIGVSEKIWCVKAPEGYSWGGSGVMCSTRDLARFAQLVMNNGEFNGEQLIPADYVKAATSRQIDNSLSGHRTYLSGNGYGYQIWMTHDDSFSFLGMGGQLAVCVPKLDLLFVCTGDVQGNPTTYNAVFEELWKQVIEKITEKSLPKYPAEEKALKEQLASLKCVLPNGEKTSYLAEKINGVTYKLNENRMGIDTLRVDFEGENGEITLVRSDEEKKIRFAMGEYLIGEFPETHYYDERIGTPANRKYRCMASALWTQPDKLAIRVYVIDNYFGNLNITLAYKGDEIALAMNKTAEWFMDEYNGVTGGRIVE